jgi:hypothetical protein
MQLRTEIEIAAPPERVWDTLVAFARYADWNPYVKAVEGKLAVGERLKLTLTPADGSERSQVVHVVKLEPGAALRWRSKFLVSRLFDGEHYFELLALDAGRTRLIHGEDLSGALVQHMGPRLTAMARGFVGMNEALKKQVEGSAL